MVPPFYITGCCTLGPCGNLISWLHLRITYPDLLIYETLQEFYQKEKNSGLQVLLAGVVNQDMGCLRVEYKFSLATLNVPIGFLSEGH